MQETFISSTAKKVNPYLLFFLICILLYIPSSFFRGPLHPDEIRNFYITKNITNLDEALLPYYLEEHYYEKPPLYFWILKLFTNTLPQAPLVLPIIFNALVAWLILSLNYKILKDEGYPGIGLISSLLLSTTGIFYGMTALARMDILFLLFIFLSIYFLWTFAKTKRLSPLFLSSFFSFLAVFTKGAFGIIFPLFIGIGISILAKDKKMFAKVILANIITVVLISIWIFSFSQIKENYFERMVLGQTIGRAINPYSHREPFFYYFPFLFLLMLPWSFLGIGYFLNIRKRKMYGWEKIFLFWFLGGFIILSLIRSKVPMYLLLLTIPFCVIAAKFLLEAGTKLKKVMLYITGAFFLIIWLGGFIYCKLSNEFIPETAILIFIVFLAGFLFMIKKPPPVQFRNFFLSWAIVIQLMNFIFFPLASSHSEFDKISKFLLKTEVKFNKVYVDDRSLLQLNIYPIPTEVIYSKSDKAICREEKAILISQRKSPECNWQKISEIDDFYVFYRAK